MDPNLLSGLGDFMKNPEMMKQAMDMLKNNPGMMENIMNMSKQPQNNNLDDTPYNLDDVVLIHSLKNEDYNNQTAHIKQYNPETLRYEIDLKDMDKTISIKADNFRLTEQDTSNEEISKEQ